jgi:threonine/homoserine/homoserine lactone efflux protein
MTGGALGFVVGWIGSMPLAGPVSALVIKRGLTGRPRHGMAIATGAALAESGWCTVAIFGYGALLDRWAWARPGTGLLGGVIMLAIGLRLIRGRFTGPALPEPSPAGEREEPTTSPPGPTGAVSGRWIFVREFFLGAGIVVINVSMLVSWLGILAALHALHAEPAAQRARLEFIVGVPLGIIAWFGLLLWALGHTRARVRHERLAGALRLLGVLLCTVGASALLTSLWKLLRA